MNTLDTFLADAAKFARAVDPLVTFVQVTQRALGIGGAPAEHIVSIVASAMQALERSAAGEITAEQAKSSLDAIMAKLDSTFAGDDAKAAAALHARFKAPTEP